ncbi:MAG TPA: sigma-70 family RNA polymerase sigma factor [Planctomycetota bacterium]|nr:sigma-70 family RNA polymerase sigma factor [Planctomycetota bacterium]
MDSRHESLRPDELLAQLGWVRALARSLVLDPDVTDDVLQQVCLLALQNAPREASTGPKLRAWLAAVTRSLAFRSSRSDVRRRRRERAAAQADSQPSTVTIAAHREAFRQLVDAVMGLDEPYYSAIVARYFDGHSVPEIAAASGASEAAVRQRLSRARQQLRTRLHALLADDERGWLRAMLPLAPSPLHVGATSLLEPAGGLLLAKSVGTGGFVKLAVGALIVACLGGAVWLFGRDDASGAKQVVARPDDNLPGELVATSGLLAQGDTSAPKPLAPEPERAAPPLPTGAFKATITGTVVAATGEPVAGATVVCVPNAASQHAFAPATEDLLAACLRQQHDSLPAEQLAWPTVQTDASGAFTITTALLPDATVLYAPLERYAQLVVHHPDHGLWVRPCRDVVRNGVLDVGEIRLPPTSRVTGLAVDSAGRPVRHAIVGALDWTATEVIPATRDRRLANSLALLLDVRTDDDGRFELASLPIGTGRVRVMASGVCDQDVQPVALFPEGHTDVGVVELGAGTSLSGIVRSLEGQPLSGVTVIAVPGTPSSLTADPESIHTALVEVGDASLLPSARSGSDGTFTIDCAPTQPSTLIATHAGFEPGFQALVPAGAIGRELRLAPQRSLALRVEDAATHEPLPAAAVSAWRLAPTPLQHAPVPEVLSVERALPQGSSAAGMPSPTHVISDVCGMGVGVHVTSPGHASEAFIVHPSEVASDGVAVLGMHPGGSLRGVVTNSAHEVVVGARVSAELVPPPVIDETTFEEAAKGLIGRGESAEYTAHREAQTVQARMQQPLETLTAADGSFALDDLVDGTWQLQASAEHRAAVRPPPVQVTAGETTRTDIVLDEAGTIAGLVLEPAGEPSAGQQVGLQPEDTTNRGYYAEIFTTDGNGAFAFASVVPGSWRLVVFNRAVEQHVDVRAGEENRLVLQLPADAVLDGIVLRDGLPAAGAHVVIKGGAFNFFQVSGSATTDERGAFSMHGVWKGDRIVQATGATGTPGPEVQVALVPGQRSFVTLTIGSSTITCRAVDRESGAPVPFARLRLYKASRAVGETQKADADGIFVFQDVPPETYSVQAVGGGSASPPHGYLILGPESWGGTHLLTMSDPVVVPAAGGELAVDVRMPRGASLSGTIASASGAPVPPHVEVSLKCIEPGDTYSRALHTDDGTFFFSPLHAGAHLVTVTIAPDVSAQAQVVLTEGSASTVALTYP